MQHFRLLTAHLKFHQICTFIGSFFRKHINIILKSTEELCLMTLKNDAKFEEELTCRFEIEIRNLTNFNLSTQKSQKICTLMDSFWPKYITFELKKVWRSYLSWHWRVMQIWRKTDLWFGKWHDGFGKFSPEHSKVSKLGLWWDPFVQSRKCTSLKFTEELCIMTIKNDTKIEKESTCHFTIDMRNLMNFYPITRKSKNLHFKWAPSDQRI